MSGDLAQTTLPTGPGEWFLDWGPGARLLLIALISIVGATLLFMEFDLLYDASIPILGSVVFGAMTGLLGTWFMAFAAWKKRILPATGAVIAIVAAFEIVIRIGFGNSTSAWLLWCGVVWMIACGVVRLAFKDVWPREAPLKWTCGTCDYDLRGVTTQVCPECGTPFKGQYETPATRA